MRCLQKPTTDRDSTPLPVAHHIKSWEDVPEDNAATSTLLHTPRSALARFLWPSPFLRSLLTARLGHSALTRAFSLVLPILVLIRPQGFQSIYTPWFYPRPHCRANTGTKVDIASVTDSDHWDRYPTSFKLMYVNISFRLALVEFGATSLVYIDCTDFTRSLTLIPVD